VGAGAVVWVEALPAGLTADPPLEPGVLDALVWATLLTVVVLVDPPQAASVTASAAASAAMIPCFIP
jgi:hypothetical protein